MNTEIQHPTPSVAHAEIRTLPASSGQERLWLTAEADGTTVPYAAPFGYHISTRLTAAQLEAAMAVLIMRHDALRTGLHWTGEGLAQQVHATVRPEVREILCTSTEEFTEALRVVAAEPFDLSRPPLVRMLHARVAPDETAFGFVFHHSICDSWSMELFLQDLTRILDGDTPDTTPGEHAAWSLEEHAWLESAEAERERAYWGDRLQDGAAPLRLGRYDRQPSRNGAVHRFAVPAPTVSQLVELTAASPFSIMLAAFGVLLHRYSLNERISIGLPLAGRLTADAEHTFGYLSNTVVALEDYAEDTTFRDAVASAFQHVADGIEHGRLPFQELVRLSGKRQEGAVPLYEAMFGPQNTPVETSHTIGGHSLTRINVHNGTAKNELTLLVEQRADKFEFEFEYDTALFDHSWAERFSVAYVQLLMSAAQAPDTPVAELPLLTAEQMAAAFAERPHRGDYLDENPAHVDIEAQARRTPEAVAVRWTDGELTYRQLNRRANAFAARIMRSGIATGSRIGVRLDRGPHLICALLGILKAGAAFVPLDPKFPMARVRTICEDAAVSAIVAEASEVAELADIAPVLVPDDDATEMTTEVQVGPNDLAYIYYTSGSTGTPKGVVIDHRDASQRLAWFRDAYPTGPGDAVLAKTPLVFDISLWEIFLPLLTGAEVLIAEPNREADPDYLRQVLRTEPVVLVHFVPVALETYLSAVEAGNYPALRWVIASGEAVPTSLLRRAHNHFGAEVHIQYGQTETAEVTVWDGTDDDVPSASTLLGREIGVYSMRVVDRALQPVPTDVPGELCVSGLGGVAWGYQNRPVITAERFVPHPGCPDGRLYRSGDVVRKLGSGLYEFLGRQDQQIKIQGCRVEPGEIENVLCAHPAVTGCVVVARRSTNGNVQLAAYIVAGDDEPSPGDLADFVRHRLPWYMVPGAFVLLPDFPRTTSGKVARDSLPAPDRHAFATKAGPEGPVGPVEAEIAAEWARVLNIQGLGRHDDFFTVGGTSLSLVRVLGAVSKRYGITLRMGRFISRPTIAALAEAVHEGIEQLVGDLSEEEALNMLEALRAHD
ncbi:non-ribosomal peptide synthetase [Streptomyces sp. LaPpAH-108]|uniref:non-ribosomal peptide synthetase n=1 Tax=Streptomyces sp. LaPpAH-108 TaxID=1155714 RepID=UPI001319D875|nr:non-ribosomal peptide synthetase [Streptomyces sp. LaPpAH-108]